MPLTDLNARIAKEVTGWELSGQFCPYGFEYWCKGDVRVCERSTWKPLEDLNQCAVAEAEIEKRGLMGRYIVLLENEANEAGTVWPLRLAFLIRLTPAQRCAAMVKAVEVQHA